MSKVKVVICECGASYLKTLDKCPKCGKARKVKKSKFNNIRCTADGIGFASKAEMHFYEELKRRQAEGSVAYFLRQVPIHLPGNIRYVVDFLVAENDDYFTEDMVVVRTKLRYIDVKGVETAMFKLKRKQVEALYPIKIETVKKVK